MTIQRTSRHAAHADDGIIDLPVVEIAAAERTVPSDIAAAMRSCLRLTPEQETTE
ncbi:MAG TPA: hypothetical protein VGF32_01070 [Streptosporangiaceae bacterium]